MKRGNDAPAWGLRALIVVLFAIAPSVVHAQGVKVALLPATLSVSPGAEFDLSIQVTRAGSAFNGFDAYIGWDPAALTFVQLSPISLQEGSYFTSACSNRFHMFHAGADRDTITDVLLCSGVSISGPGQIYKLHFRASNTPGVTQVRFLPGLQFYNAGLYVNPDSSSDATITIGVAGVADPSPHSGARFAAYPNPSRDGTHFTIEMDRAGRQELTVCDLLGRVVRHVQSGVFPAGIRTVGWDGRNDSGAVAPPGIYLGKLRAGTRTLNARFALVK